MELKFTKKLILAILLLLSSVVYCYSQESSSEQHATTELNTLGLWNGIEWNLDLLEQEQNNMTRLLAEQKKSTAELEKAYQDSLLLYQDLENKYRSSKNATAIWRTYSMIATGVAIATTTILVLNNK